MELHSCEPARPGTLDGVSSEEWPPSKCSDEPFKTRPQSVPLMDGATAAIAVSLFVLSGLLAVLSARGVLRFGATRAPVQLAWTVGLLFATAAMLIESVVYLGVLSDALLAAYIFLSAAIVGVLSLGATRVLHSVRIQRAYAGYILATCALVGVASFSTPVPGGMVSGGIIDGNPSVLLVLLSSTVTFPATVVLLAASVVALRRTRDWQNLLMIAGALILGAGGTLYIASFPVALYYAEFLGIVLLFFGLVSLAHRSTAPVPRTAGSSAG